MRIETCPKESVIIFILEKYASHKKEETSESETRNQKTVKNQTGLRDLQDKAIHSTYSSNDHEKMAKQAQLSTD